MMGLKLSGTANMKTHKELLNNLIDYYSSQCGEVGKSIDKDFLKQIISETIVQTSMLSVNELVSFETKAVLYNNAIHSLRSFDSQTEKV